jgi:hypothetical protein
MDQKLEHALLRTYRKLREKPLLTNAELVGVFVNYYYSENNVHSGLDTRGFSIIRKDGVVAIRLSKTSQYFELSTLLSNDLAELTEAQFYALWLRSSFEDPHNDFYGDEICKKVTSVATFITEQENHYTKYINSKT